MLRAPARCPRWSCACASGAVQPLVGGCHGTLFILYRRCLPTDQLQRGEVVRGARALGGGRGQRPMVGAQQRRPEGTIGCVVRVGSARKPEVGQDEGGAELGHQLLGSVGAAAEPTREVAVEAVRGAGPVHESWASVPA